MLPWWLSSKESTCNAGDLQEAQVRTLGQADPGRRKWQPTPEFLPGKSQGQTTRQATVHGVVKESDMT